VVVAAVGQVRPKQPLQLLLTPDAAVVGEAAEVVAEVFHLLLPVVAEAAEVEVAADSDWLRRKVLCLSRGRL
jgi:hypothetical protein